MKYGNILITIKIWKHANYNGNMETCFTLEIWKRASYNGNKKRALQCK